MTTSNSSIANEDLIRYFTPLWVQVNFNYTSMSYNDDIAIPAAPCSTIHPNLAE